MLFPNRSPFPLCSVRALKKNFCRGGLEWSTESHDAGIIPVGLSVGEEFHVATNELCIGGLWGAVFSVRFATIRRTFRRIVRRRNRTQHRLPVHRPEENAACS